MKSLIEKGGVCVVLLLGLSMIVIANQGEVTGTVRGRVTDLFGFPVSDAEIEVLAESSQKRFQAKTDVNGSYEVKNVPADQLSIRINSIGFLRDERRVRLANGETLLVDFGLEVGRLTDLPVSTVSGTVYGPENTPLKDATTRVTSAFKPSVVFVTRTDERGRFLLRIGPPGQYIVSVLKPGYVISTKTVLLMPDLPRKDATANFVLEPFKLN